MFRFGVISAYPDEDWHSARLVEACRVRGRADVFSPSAFTVRVDGGRTTILCDGRDVREWDVWLTPRAVGDQGDHDFQCGAYAGIGELGVPVVNPVPALLTALDKARCSWLLARAGVPTPPVVAAQTLAEARAALAAMRDAVLKPPYGSLGRGVVRLRAGQPAAGRAMRRALARHGVAYLQRFVRARRAGRDRRLFVVGGRVVAAIERIAPAGEFRANVHLGGRARAIRPSAEAEAIAVAAARVLRLEYAGVDLVDARHGPTVLEVNGTPRWEGILDATGRDMAEAIAAHAAALGLKRRSNREEHPWQSRRKREI